MNLPGYEGQVLGQYELRELLGVGGMGSVFRAYQLNLQREVAIKLLSPVLASQPGYVERFTREARTAAALEHTHIIPIYDYGVQDYISFVVMRLLTGGTLAQRLAQRSGTSTPLPSLVETRALLAQLASALDYAHSQGVIHRDIKPSNVMFDNQGSAFLTDFGIAKLAGATSSLTGTSMVMGTPSYMPPEQWQGATLTPAADQYALAVMLYVLLTGRLPFEADTPFALMNKHVNEAPTPPRLIRPEIPDAVTLVLQRAMSKQPSARFRTTTAFAQAFDAAVEGQQASSTQFFTFKLKHEPVQGSTTPSRSPVARASTPSKTTPPPARSLRALAPWLLLGLGALAVLILILAVLSNSNNNDLTALNLRETSVALAFTEQALTRPPEEAQPTSTTVPTSGIIEILPSGTDTSTPDGDLTATLLAASETRIAGTTATADAQSTVDAQRSAANATATAARWTATPTTTPSPTPSPTPTDSPAPSIVIENFTAEPAKLIRYITQEVVLSWEVTGGTRVTFTGLEPNTESTVFGPVDSLALSLIAYDSVTIHLWAEGPLDQTAEASLLLPVEDPACRIQVDNTPLRLGPSNLHRVMAIIGVDQTVTPDARDGSGSWLRIPAPGAGIDAPRLWLPLTNVVCLNFEPNRLPVDSAPPTPLPTATVMILTSTPAPTVKYTFTWTPTVQIITNTLPPTATLTLTATASLTPTPAATATPNASPTATLANNVTAGSSQIDAPCILPTRMTNDACGHVLPGPLPNAMRSAPGTGSDSTVLGNIPGGTMFSVLEGPVCASGYNWWKVNASGFVGWTAEGGNGEYWLAPSTCPGGIQAEPYTPQPTISQSPENLALHRAANFTGGNTDWESFVYTFPDDPASAEMVLVPAGRFMMGSEDGANNERPVHEQVFDTPYWIDRTEVTRAQYASCVAAGVCTETPDNGYSQRDQQPINQVTWFQAEAYCAWRGTRLPTEAEWEYAARGPNAWVYPWGNTWHSDNAVWADNSGGTTANVMSRAAGASWVDAFDLSGNVWEWVSSLSMDYPYDSSREVDMNTNSYRILRGGSFITDSDSLRAAFRGKAYANVYSINYGFRCARSSLTNSVSNTPPATTPAAPLISTVPSDLPFEPITAANVDRLIVVREFASRYLPQPAISPDGRWFVLGTFSSLQIRNLLNGGFEFALSAESDTSITAVTFSPNARYLAVAQSNAGVVIWDMSTREKYLEFGGAENYSDIAFNPNGTMLATANYDGTIRLWNALLGTQIREIAGRGSQLTFSPDGTLLASTGLEGFGDIFLDEVESGTLRLQLHGDYNRVVFNPDGTQIAASGPFDRIRTFDVTSGDLLATSSYTVNYGEMVDYNASGDLLLVTANGYATTGTSSLVFLRANDLAVIASKTRRSDRFTPVFGPESRILLTVSLVPYSSEDSIQIWAVPEQNACLVQAPRDINLREGPGTDTSTVGVLFAGEPGYVTGKIFSEGYNWWQVVHTYWVRSDVVTTQGDCNSVPAIDPATGLPVDSGPTPTTPEQAVSTATTSAAPPVSGTSPETAPLDAALLRAQDFTGSNSDWEPFAWTFEDDPTQTDMVLVPAGCFRMGSNELEIEFAYQQCQLDYGENQCQLDWFEKEGPDTEVCFDEPFWIDRTEVTNGELGSSGYFSGENNPREQISWFEAAAFCDSRGGRLPTEAEWEYAARGPASLIYPWGNRFDPENVVYNDGTTLETRPVGLRPDDASWIGAVDMSGNVREWTSSQFEEDNYPYNPDDGRESPGSASERVIRGGSFLCYPVSLRNTDRTGAAPALEDWNIGFRCVRD